MKNAGITQKADRRAQRIMFAAYGRALTKNGSPNEIAETLLDAGRKALAPPGWMTLSAEEWDTILATRAERVTGYLLHREESGRYYVWSMGCQPSGRRLAALARPTIGEAVEAFLTLYEENRDPHRPDYLQPIKRRRTRRTAKQA